MTQKLCFLDLEATGFDKQKDSIIEVAFLIRDGNKNITTRFESVFVPDKSPLTDFIAQLTGISQTEIDETGKNLDDYKTELRTLIGDSIIVGHNIDFDIDYLTANGVDLSQNPRIDTHELARILLVNEESYALEVLAHKYGFEQSSAHRAMSDVEVNVDIYDWLVEKIKDLPTNFIEDIKPALESKTEWYAKKLFLHKIQSVSTQKNQSTNPFVKGRKDEGFSVENNPTASLAVENLTLAQHTFIRAGNNRDNATVQKALAHQNTPSLIITDKLDFFSDIKIVPTPNVILSPGRLETFLTNRPHLTDQEITFYLQCKRRHHLGYRGKKYFDLFFNQRDLWNEVCLRGEILAENREPRTENRNASEIETWEQIMAERGNEEVLVMSPYAYLQLKDHPVLKDRTLIIDEIENFAETLLLSVARETSIRPYLEDESTTVAAQFWVRNVCRDVLEPLLQKSLPPFPSKVLLPPQAQYPDLAEAWNDFATETDQLVATHLNTPLDGVVRWINYYPSTGNLSIGTWSSHAWKEARNHLQTKKIVAFTRTNRSDAALDFVRYFLGIKDPVWRELTALKTNYQLIIPVDLISVKSPDLNLFTAEKIREYAQKLPADERLVANFTSQESLQKVYTDLKLSTTLNEDHYAILGERASGGSGKVTYLAQASDNKILCHQQAADKVLSQLPYTTFVLQKFPFSPPHPLLERIEAIMKTNGKNFWDTWTMIQTGANLARRVAVFPHTKNIIILDGRENTRWGKKLLQQSLSF